MWRRCAASGADPFLEFLRRAVDDEFFREIGLADDFFRERMIADIEVDVRIAAHDDVRAVLLAGLQHLLGEVARAGAAAARAVGAVVALEQDVALCGSLGNLVEVDREARIVRMADDLDLWDPHGAHDGRRVVEFRTRIDAGVV